MVTILFEPDSEVLNMDNDLPCCEYLTSSKLDIDSETRSGPLFHLLPLLYLLPLPFLFSLFQPACLKDLISWSSETQKERGLLVRL